MFKNVMLQVGDSRIKFINFRVNSSDSSRATFWVASKEPLDDPKALRQLMMDVFPGYDEPATAAYRLRDGSYHGVLVFSHREAGVLRQQTTVQYFSSQQAALGSYESSRWQPGELAAASATG